MRTRTIAITLLLCVSAGPVLAEAPMASRLPRRTMAYMGWAGWNDALEQSLFGQLVREPAARELWAGIRRMLVDLDGGQHAETMAHVWEVGTTILKRPGAVGLVDLDFPEDGPPHVVVAMVVDLGEAKAAFQKHLGALLAKLPESVRIENLQAEGGVAFTEIQPQGGPVFRLAYKGDLLIAALGKAGADLLNVTAADSLLTNPTFKKQFAAVDGKNVQNALFVDAATILKRVDGMLGPPRDDQDHPAPTPRKVIAALGLEKLQGLAVASHVADEGMVSKTRIFSSPGPHEGLMALFDGGKLTDADLAHVPADADLFLAMKLSPQRVLDQIRRGIKIVAPDEIEDFNQELGEVEEEFGLSLEKELLPAMGDTWVLASAPSYGGFLTGTVLTVDLKDPVAFGKAADKIVAVMKREFPGNREREEEPGRRGYRRGPAVEAVTIRGVKVQYVSFAGDDVPFAPAWAVHGSRLYVALFPQVVAAAATMPAEKSITNSPAYAALRKKLGADTGAAILSYVDLGSISRQAYHVMLVGWTMGSNYLAREMLPQAAVHWLPSLAALNKYLKPGIEAVVSDDQGVTITSYTGLPLPGIEAIPVVAAVMMPAVVKARGSAREAQSMSHLHMISQACMTYRMDKRRYPPDLAALVMGGRYLRDARSLRAPTDPRPPLRIVDGKLVGEPSYVYIAGHDQGRAERPFALVLAYLPPELNPGGRALVAFLDGHVEKLSPRELQQALAHTKAAMKKAAKGSGEDF